MKAKTYHEWFLSHQEKLMAELAEEGGRTQETDEAMTVEVVRYSHLKNYILSGENQPDILIACDDDGEPAEYAVPMIRAFFAEHVDLRVVQIAVRRLVHQYGHQNHRQHPQAEQQRAQGQLLLPVVGQEAPAMLLDGFVEFGFHGGVVPFLFVRKEVGAL